MYKSHTGLASCQLTAGRRGAAGSLGFQSVLTNPEQATFPLHARDSYLLVGSEEV